MSEQSFSSIFLDEFEVNDSLTREIYKSDYFVIAHLICRVLVKIEAKIKFYFKLSKKRFLKLLSQKMF